MADDLRRRQEEHGVKEDKQLKLKQDVIARWSSTFEMATRFLELKHDVTAILMNHPEAPPMLTAAELATLSAVKSVLQPFADATEFSGEQYVTLSSVITILNSVREVISGGENRAYCPLF